MNKKKYETPSVEIWVIEKVGICAISKEGDDAKDDIFE